MGVINITSVVSEKNSGSSSKEMANTLDDSKEDDNLVEMDDFALDSHQMDSGNVENLNEDCDEDHNFESIADGDFMAEEEAFLESDNQNILTEDVSRDNFDMNDDFTTEDTGIRNQRRLQDDDDGGGEGPGSNCDNSA